MNTAGSDDSMRFVLDASVALAWFFVDERNDYSMSVHQSLERSEAIVPWIWPLEVANVFLVGERRGRNTSDDGEIWLNLLKQLPIILDEQNIGALWSAVPRIARKHNLSIYDACYLELSLRRALPLATLDAKLLKAANDEGIERFNP